MSKQFLRGVIKAVAGLAGLVLIFDNHFSQAAVLLLLGSFAVLAVCVLAWRKLDLGEDKWFSPKKPDA